MLNKVNNADFNVNRDLAVEVGIYSGGLVLLDLRDTIGLLDRTDVPLIRPELP